MPDAAQIECFVDKGCSGDGARLSLEDEMRAIISGLQMSIACKDDTIAELQASLAHAYTLRSNTSSLPSTPSEPGEQVLLTTSTASLSMWRHRRRAVHCMYHSKINCCATAWPPWATRWRRQPGRTQRSLHACRSVVQVVQVADAHHTQAVVHTTCTRTSCARQSSAPWLQRSVVYEPAQQFHSSEQKMGG